MFLIIITVITIKTKYQTRMIKIKLKLMTKIEKTK